MCTKIMQVGIHTFSLYKSMSYSKAQNVVELLKDCKHIHKISSDSMNVNHTFISDIFSDNGVIIYVYQKIGILGGVTLRVSPSTLLSGKFEPTDLYEPNKDNYKAMVKKLNKMLKKLGLDFKADKMSISRCDPCVNIKVKNDNILKEYLRIFHKSLLMHCYKREMYKKSNKKVKNCRLANMHSYRQSSKYASVTVYDKTFQLQQINRLSNELIGKSILRIETELKRQAIKRRLSKKSFKTNYSILKGCFKDTKKFLNRYINLMSGSSGEYVKYSEAHEIISSAKMKDKMRSKMLYLLRKTSDSESLTAAVDKLKREFDLSNSQCRNVLKKFDKLGISPITLTNDSKIAVLPSVRELI